MTRPSPSRHGKSRPPVRVPDGRGAYCVFNEGAVQLRPWPSWQGSQGGRKAHQMGDAPVIRAASAAFPTVCAGQ